MYLTAKAVLFFAAAVGFVLAAFSIGSPRINLGWLGAAFGTLAFLVDSNR